MQLAIRLSRVVVAFSALLLASWLWDGALSVSPDLSSHAAQVDPGAYSGTLLYLDGGAIWQLDLRSGDRQRIVDGDSGLITHLAHSPDRQRIAYSVLYLGAGYQTLGSDVVVASASGSNPRTVVHETGAQVTVTWPAWSGDGTRLIYATTNLGERVQRLEEVDLATGTRAPVMDGGASPSLSPDGQWVAYSYAGDRGWGIRGLHRPTGRRVELVSDAWFLDSDDPSFSPDGTRVAFVAAGNGPPPGSAVRPALRGLLAALRTRIASAHDIGEPFDLWSVQPDGANLRRIALLGNEQPYLCWSPDGQHIAAWGAQGLQIVDAATGRVQRVDLTANSSPISWGY